MLWRRRRAYLARKRQRLDSSSSETEEAEKDVVIGKSRPLLRKGLGPSEQRRQDWGVVEGYADPWRVSLYRHEENDEANEK